MEQLEEFLCVFDDEARYPAKGPTYSAFFYPRAFASGWRLRNEAVHLWAALHPIRVRSMTGEASMECVSIAIQHFLTEYSDQDAPGWSGTSAVWKAAVEASDYDSEQPADEEE